MIFNFKSLQFNKCCSAYYMQGTVLAGSLPSSPTLSVVRHVSDMVLLKIHCCFSLSSQEVLKI